MTSVQPDIHAAPNTTETAERSSHWIRGSGFGVQGTGLKVLMFTPHN